MNDVAMAIGHDLKFDVARIDDKLFQIHLIVSECLLRLMTRAMEGGFKAWLIMRGAHPAAAPAGSRLNHHRVTKFLCDFHRFILSFNDSIAARRYRHARFARSRTSSVLITHRLHRPGGRPYELDVAAFADLHEMRILSEESIPGMNCINITDFGRAHDPIAFQIALKARRGPDADCFVGELDVQRSDVCFRIHREGANAEFLTGANHS